MTCALAFGLLGLSLTSEGLFITQVDLNDSGVWVTNQAALHIGRYNHSAKQLDGASYVTESSRFDVLQDRATVFVLGPDEGRIVPVTPATLKMAPPVAMGVGAQISLGGSMVSVFSPIEGKYWLVPASAAASLDPTSDVIPAAISELSSETIAIVGADGTGYVVDPVAQVLYTVGSERVSFAGEVSVKSQSLKGLSEKGEFALTVVGQTPVLLDRTAGTLHIGASRSLPLLVDNDTDVVVLQAVAESGDAIVYSTPTAVITQPLRGGDPNVVPAPATRGLPAPAVVLEGCTYAVWSGTGAFVRDCVDEGNDLVKVIPGIDPNDELRFRVNWGHIVLNQVQSGGVWLVTNQIIKVDNWDAVIETQDQMDDQDSSDDLDQMEKPDRTGENHPPRAYDDAFGARAGTSVLLPVVENDLDEDGDLLTVELLGDLPRGYTISTVYSNSVFQLNVPATATGTLSFRYKVSDGRGGEDEANVKVAIYSDSINTAPTAIRSTVLTVTSGHQVTHNILSNWRDPEGDPIFLIGAITSPEDMVTTLQDGSVTFQDGGVSTGVKVVQVTVSDGKLATTSEVLVNVLPAGNRPPVAVPDLVSGTAGTPIMIRPLDNDTDPDGDVLRLTSVEGDSRCSLTKELSQGYVTAVCHSPGSVYLTYTVTDGRSVNVEGWIRVVVTPPATTNDPPIAVPDTVLLTQGQETYVKPLENDIDPLGFPLVITKIETGVDLPIDVSVIDFEVVKITPNREFSTPISLNYTISNGVGFATSRILVVPVPAPERILPPRAVDDTVVVRVGDIANVAVLSNDIQPNGIGLRLRPDLPSVPNPETEALVFTSGNLIRIHARAPGTYTVLYQVENVKGNAESDTGRLTIHVRDVDTGDNQAPKPRDVEVRTLAGRAVTVPIPLDGIDPDGDFVTLVGLGSAPTKGAITATTSRSFVYDPGTSIGGGDSFTYVVRDRLGLEATGTVRVGIAPATSYNRPPIAMTDFVDARPGSLVTVPVTANDTGPDAADCCFLVANSVVSEDFEAKTQGNDVVITAPSTPGSYWGTYEVADEFGQTSTGVIALRVAADIELRKPIARDDEVPLVEALKNPTVTISVKDNDRDPDGDISLAKITVNDPNAVVVGDQVTVTITPDWQIIDYYITDTDGLVGHAFILVPGVDTIGPQYNPAVRILEVRTGETVSVPLSSYVVVRPGRQPRVTQAATVTAWNGTVEARTVTELRFTAPQDYVGPAAITLEVTDGANLEDDTGLVALVTIPVRVIPRDDGSGINLPPTMLSVDLNVEVGESGTLQLDRLVTNPEPTDTLTFNLVSESPLAGVKPSLTGSTLTVTVNPDVPRGTQLPVKVSVDDGHNPPVEAEITVKIVGSRRPLPQAVDDIIPDAVQGASRCVNVTANDMNPFPGKPLVVIGAVIETGAGGTAVPGCAGGAGVTVTPAPTFYGEMVIRYTIRDATGDPTREASARIYLNVRGRPDPPSGLHIDQVGDRQVILSWQPPNNNGAAITTYTVTSTPEAAGYPMRCETTTCVLSGLTNNVTYRFTVTATNGVGTSDPSLPSTEARPDAVPYRLEAPSINFGDKAVTLTWVPRGSPGSPVTSYDLQISPPPPSGQSIINAVGTGYTWTGLSNGTAYQVRVCARNLAVGVCDEDSHWSTFSIEMIPAGLPDPPGTPTWTRLNPVGSEAQVEVCWGEPYENGAPISSYLLRSSAGHTYTVSPTGGQTCRVTTLPTSQTDYTFDVAATNKAGQGGFSNSSAGFRAMTPPGPVTGASAADRDRSCQVTFTGAALNGARSSEVTYKWSTAGASGNFGTNTSGLATGLTNSGVAQTITLWATTTVQGVSQDGPTTTVSCNPYGPPNQPGVTAAKSTDPNSAVVYLTWTAPSPNGRSIVSTQVWVDGNDQGMQAASGSTSANGTWSQNHSIRVRVCDSTGQCAENTTSANANPSPKPPPSVTMWRTNTNCSHGSANCKLLAVKTANFSGNVTCQVVWTSVGLHDGWVPWVQGPDETKSGGQTDWPGLGVGVYAEIVCGGVSSTRVLVQ